MSGRALVAMAVLLAVVASACGTTAAGPAAAPSRVADLLSGHDGTLDGGPFEEADLDGVPVVLWFWAPWCTICRAEAPEVAEVAAALEREQSPVQIVGVPGQGEREAMAEFVTATGAGDITHLVDTDGAVWNRLGVIGQPAFAFVSADGQVSLVNGALGGSALRERALALAGAAS